MDNVQPGAPGAKGAPTDKEKKEKGKIKKKGRGGGPGKSIVHGPRTYLLYATVGCYAQFETISINISGFDMREGFRFAHKIIISKIKYIHL